MIPSKSKALLVSRCATRSGSLMLNWAGLGLAIVFLAFAAHHGA